MTIEEKVKKPEIIQVERTLSIVRNVMAGLDYTIVGSYSREVIHGDKAEDPFNELSDLDIALRREDTKPVSQLLIASSYFNRVITSMDYNRWPKFHGRDIPEFRVKGPNLTPVHLIGSLETDHFRTSIVIDGIRYIETKPGMY